MMPIKTSANRLRILIVDDIPQVLEDLGILLELDPANEVVGKVGSGQEAIRMAQRLEPDLILMDLEMPGVNGYEAASAIKTLCPSSVIAAHTIHSHPEDRRRALASGFDLFVEKGTSLELVLKNIQK
jgi:DNA-binding NarL/FixJ family response regulator